MSVFSVSSLKRKRGQPTAEEAAIMAAAKRRQTTLDREAISVASQSQFLKERGEQDLPALPRSVSSAGTEWGADESAELREELAAKSVAEITGVLEARLKDVRSVASHSKNLKGLFVRALKDAVVVGMSAARELNIRTQAQFQADSPRRINQRLREEVATPKKQVVELVAKVQNLRGGRTPPSI